MTSSPPSGLDDSQSEPIPVAVTGACGFIGSHLVTGLRRAGHPVLGVDITATDSDGAHHVCDLTDPLALATAFREHRIGAVVHGAWAGHPRSAMRDYPGQIRGGVAPTAATALAVGLAQVPHLIMLSSGGGQARPGPDGLISAYGWAKRAAEAAASATAEAFSFTFGIIRPSAVYGPGQDPAKGLGAVTTFATAIASGRPIKILGSDSVTRDYLHVSDLAEAIRLAIEARVAGVFELGGPEPVSLGELVALFERISGRAAIVERVPATGVDQDVVLLDNRPFSALTGWTPKIRVEQAAPRLFADIASMVPAG